MADGKWITGLTADMPIADAARAVVATRFAVVKQYLPLVAEQADQDPEYVHQLRVGTRRSGAALQMFANCFPRKQAKAAKNCLRSIRQAAGDARDWDVFRLALAKTKILNGNGRPARDFLTGYAMGQRAAAQVRLKAAVLEFGPVFEAIAEDLPALARDPHSHKPAEKLGTFAGVRIGELLATFEQAVAANPTDPAELHQLRILAKRLRYALEIFAECFPPELKDTLYPAVEQAQEVLGEVQDAVVGRDRLIALSDMILLCETDAWERLKPGFDSLLHSNRSKIPAGRKAFQLWRKAWNEQINATKQAVASVITQTAETKP